ncbi:MAG TPA: hypothetical protein PK970_08375 [Hyphomicrobiaceae bacterium]|nr:hypothetical protein [Hyphomicrobiaceae bacterium]
MMQSIIKCGVATFASLGLSVFGSMPAVVAQTRTVAQPQAQAQVQARSAPGLPSPETMLALVRTHMLALDHAVRTGRFDVLHALSGPYLRNRLTVEQLALAFRRLQIERPDLVAAAITTPTLARAPTLSADGMLRLGGTFPVQGKEIRFEMVFESPGREWQLAGLDVGVIDAVATNAVQRRK